jgi:hypothetical protein
MKRQPDCSDGRRTPRSRWAFDVVIPALLATLSPPLVRDAKAQLRLIDFMLVNLEAAPRITPGKQLPCQTAMTPPPEEGKRRANTR